MCVCVCVCVWMTRLFTHMLKEMYVYMYIKSKDT